MLILCLYFFGQIKTFMALKLLDLFFPLDVRFNCTETSLSKTHMTAYQLFMLMSLSSNNDVHMVEVMLFWNVETLAFFKTSMCWVLFFSSNKRFPKVKLTNLKVLFSWRKFTESSFSVSVAKHTWCRIWCTCHDVYLAKLMMTCTGIFE